MVILELKVVWDNGALIATPAVLVSIDPKRRLGRIHKFLPSNLNNSDEMGLAFFFFFRCVWGGA